MSHPGHRHTQGCASLVRHVPAWLWIHKGMYQTLHGHDTMVTGAPAWHRYTGMSQPGQGCTCLAMDTQRDTPAWSQIQREMSHPGDRCASMVRDRGTCPLGHKLPTLAQTARGTHQPGQGHASLGTICKGHRGWGSCSGDNEGENSRVCPGVQRSLSSSGILWQGSTSDCAEGHRGYQRGFL